MSPCAVAVLAGMFGVAAASSVLAAGHGPVFGLTTPTNAAKGWTVDFAVMGRQGETGDGVMFRSMLTYGVTEDFQVSASFPVVFNSAALAPARLTSMMPGSADVEGLVAWRFHRQGTDVGRRFESTAYAGAIFPGPQRPAGLVGELRRAPGVYAAVATGVASRSHYVWGGLGYTRFAESNGDRRSDLLLYSVVWGYRPPAWRTDYPRWDWRLFVEMTGENAGKVRRGGADIGGTGGHQILLGPTALGIYKNYAIEGGVQFPVYRKVGPKHGREDFRFALNLSCFF